MAVLISSIVLTIGLGVYLRTYKELYFSNFWTQSQIAFAAADSGLECALYLETHLTAPLECFGNSLVGWTPGDPAGGSFQESTYGGCVEVMIIKAPSPLLPVGITMRIESRGYNDACGSTNPRRVERGIKLEW